MCPDIENSALPGVGGHLEVPWAALQIIQSAYRSKAIFVLRVGLVQFSAWVLIFLSINSYSAAPLEECGPDCVPVGEWQFAVGLGLGLRTNPLLGEKETPLVVLPEVVYYGERFFINNMELGFTLTDTRKHQLNLLAMPSYDQMYFNRWDPLNFFSDPGNVSSVPSSSAPRVNVEINYPSSSEAVSTSGFPGAPSSSSSSSSSGAVPSGRERITFDDVSSVSVNGDLVFDGGALTEAAGDWGVTYDGTVVISNAGADDTIEVTTHSSGVKQTTEVQVQNEGLVAQPVVNTQSQALGPNWRASLSKRRVAALAGLEYSYGLGRMSFIVHALSDVSGVHHGQEVRLLAAVPWRMGNNQLTLSLGGNWQSEEILDYYYGLTEAETGVSGFSYGVNTGAVTSIFRLDWERPINDKWSLRGFWQTFGLPAEIRKSPMIEDDTVHSVFFGGVYYF